MEDINNYVKNLQRENETLKTLVIDNMTIINANRGKCDMKLDITSDMLNVHHMIHGGVLFTLADSASGASCVSLGKKIVTLNSTINYIKAIGTGTILARGEVIHAGKSTMVTNVHIYEQSSKKLLCTASFTMFVIGQYDME